MITLVLGLLAAPFAAEAQSARKLWRIGITMAAAAKGTGATAKAVGKAGLVARRARPARNGSGPAPLARRLAEALEQQAATTEILRVIRRLPADVQPVFDVIAERAMRLCGALHGGVVRYDGTLVHLVAHVDVSPAFAEALRRTYPSPPSRGMAGSRAILSGATVHIPDVEVDPDYELSEAARAAGFRSSLAVPMLREGRAVGAIVVFGAESAPFSERHVEILQSFADQAMIAVENARQFTELEVAEQLTKAQGSLTAERRRPTPAVVPFACLPWGCHG